MSSPSSCFEFFLISHSSRGSISCPVNYKLPHFASVLGWHHALKSWGLQTCQCAATPATVATGRILKYLSLAPLPTPTQNTDKRLCSTREIQKDLGEIPHFSCRGSCFPPLVLHQGDSLRILSLFLWMPSRITQQDPMVPWKGELRGPNLPPCPLL